MVKHLKTTIHTRYVLLKKAYHEFLKEKVKVE